MKPYIDLLKDVCPHCGDDNKATYTRMQKEFEEEVDKAIQDLLVELASKPKIIGGENK